ncbi:MAG: hypothetical protein R3B54_01175 [Bdellovibrionota bacterium]
MRRIWFHKLILFIAVLSLSGCFNLKLFGNATGYGGGHPLLALMKAKVEKMRRVAMQTKIGVGNDLLFVLKNGRCPTSMESSYCAAIENLSEDQRIYLRSIFLASLDEIDSFLSRDTEFLFEIGALDLYDEHQERLIVAADYGPAGPLKIDDRGVPTLKARELVVLLGQRTFNKIRPQSPFSSNGYLLPTDYIRNYNSYPFFSEGHDLSRLLGLGWMLLLDYQENDCDELVSPLQQASVHYGSDRELGEYVGGGLDEGCSLAWRVGTSVGGPQLSGLARGLHKATFAVAVDALKTAGDADQTVAVIEVVDTQSSQVIGANALHWSDFNSSIFHHFELLFENSDDAVLDFRIRSAAPSVGVRYLGTLVEGVLGGQVFYPGWENTHLTGSYATLDPNTNFAIDTPYLRWDVYGQGFVNTSGSSPEVEQYKNFTSQPIRTLQAGTNRLVFFISYSSSSGALSGPFTSFVIRNGVSSNLNVLVSFDEFSGPGVIHPVVVEYEHPQGAVAYIDMYRVGPSVAGAQFRFHGIAIVPDPSQYPQGDTGVGEYDFALRTDNVVEQGAVKSYYTADADAGSYCRYLEPAEFHFVRNKHAENSVTGYMDDPSIVQRTATMPYLFHGGLCPLTNPGAYFSRPKGPYFFHLKYLRDQGDGTYCESFALHIDPDIDLTQELADPTVLDLPYLNRVRGLSNAGRCAEYPEPVTPQFCSLANCAATFGATVYVSPAHLPANHYCTEFIQASVTDPSNRRFVCSPVNQSIRYVWWGDLYYDAFLVPEGTP